MHERLGRAERTWQHTLDIEVPADEVERRLEEVARRDPAARAACRASVTGEVPLELVRQHFAEAVEQRVPRDVRAAARPARRSTRRSLDPVVPPLVRNLRFTPGAPLTLRGRGGRAARGRGQGLPRDQGAAPRARRWTRPRSSGCSTGCARSPRCSWTSTVRPSAATSCCSTRRGSTPTAGASPDTRARIARIELGAPGLLPDLENGLLGAEAGQERTIDVALSGRLPGAGAGGQERALRGQDQENPGEEAARSGR